MRKLLICLAAGLLLASCNPPESEEDLTATPTPEATEAAPGAASMERCEDREPKLPDDEGLEDTDEKPKIEVPEGAPPCALVSQDIVDGDGKEVKEGATVTIHYAGVAWSTGEEFDSSWSRGEPATFPLSGLIAGWQEGIPGMKEGGRRVLFIPPDLGYGDQGSPPAIAPGETLIFVIDMVDAQAG